MNKKKEVKHPRMIQSGLVSPGPSQSFGPMGSPIIEYAGPFSKADFIISGLFSVSLLAACIIMLLINS